MAQIMLQGDNMHTGLHSTRLRLLVVSSMLMMGSGCGGSDSSEPETPATPAPETTATPTPVTTPTPAITAEGLDFANFLAGSLVGDVEIVECTLTNGTVSTCYQFTTTGDPIDHEVGPFCPDTIDEGAEAGGKWIENGTLVDISGEYITTLSTVYNDLEWDRLYDINTREVFQVTGENCAAAAQLNPPEEFWYTCINCTIEDFGGVVEQNYTIPVVPVPRETIAELGNDFPGVALNGVLLSFPADLDGIISTYNIAAIDDCAGHVNNAESYHYHGAAGCPHEIEQVDHAPLIGYAMDGYGIYAMVNADGVEPTDLDECRGHTDADRGYHYHATSPSENSFIGCFHGETVFEENAGGPPGGGPPGGGPPGGGPPDGT